MLDKWMAHARSKLANVMGAKAQAAELAELGVLCVSLHPGLDTSTGLFRAQRVGAFIMGNLLSSAIGVQTTWQSVQTILYCALEQRESLTPGAYYSQFYKGAYRDGQTGGWPMTSPSPLVESDEACARLLQIGRKVL